MLSAFRIHCPVTPALCCLRGESALVLLWLPFRWQVFLLLLSVFLISGLHNFHYHVSVLGPLCGFILWGPLSIWTCSRFSTNLGCFYSWSLEYLLCSLLSQSHTASTCVLVHRIVPYISSVFIFVLSFRLRNQSVFMFPGSVSWQFQPATRPCSELLSIRGSWWCSVWGVSQTSLGYEDSLQGLTEMFIPQTDLFQKNYHTQCSVYYGERVCIKVSE